MLRAAVAASVLGVVSAQNMPPAVEGYSQYVQQACPWSLYAQGTDWDFAENVDSDKSDACAAACDSTNGCTGFEVGPATSSSYGKTGGYCALWFNGSCSSTKSDMIVLTASQAVATTYVRDAAMRDYSVSAIYADIFSWRIIDPFNGRVDLKARLLRHVSPAFAEDPLRVLRVARFAARYHWLGFQVADDTLMLMKQLSDSGELGYLVAERVWKETSRALMERDPQVFFQVLHRCGALHALFPELAALDGVPQPEQHHPEVDTLLHQFLCLKQAARLGLSLNARYALLCHDLGKGKTPKEEWPRHIAHEIRSARLSKKVSKRLKVPKEAATLATLVAEFHTHSHRALELKPATVWKLLSLIHI